MLEYDTPLSHDTTADHVFGQPNFNTNTVNNGGVSAASLFQPLSMALDMQSNLYIADSGNHRVLEFDVALTNPMADHVFGQPDFTHNTANLGGSPRADCLDSPESVAVDAFGNLYVADEQNSRVLAYDAPLSDPIADHVFGQIDFIQHTPNRGGSPSADSLSFPFSVALDAQNNLYVSDYFNFRVLEYDQALVKIFLPLVRR